MSFNPNDEDVRIGAMLHALSEAIVEEFPEAGFVLIMGRSADDDTAGSLLSLSNLDDETVVSVLETILERRRGGRPSFVPTVQ